MEKEYRSFVSYRPTIDLEHAYLKKEYETSCEKIKSYLRCSTGAPPDICKEYTISVNNLRSFLDEKGYRMPAKLGVNNYGN